jgi:hypothetical protein
MKYYFKVRYGFKTTDFVSVEAGGELEKAICAWTTGSIAEIGGKMINGNNIISIEPHYHKYTGWYDNYEPKEAEDWKQIERDCPDNFEGVLSHFRERVQYLIAKNQVAEIGKGKEIPELQVDTNRPPRFIEKERRGEELYQLRQVEQ